MNALLNRPKKALKNFHAQHGPMDDWSGDDFEHLLDLLVVVNTPGPVARARLRLTLLVWTGAAMPVYALGELLWAVQNKVSRRVEAVMDRLDDRCSNIESACQWAGDDALIERIGRVFDLVSTVANSVGKKAARLVRG
ncbi:hypothetical protein EES45_36325 [Streptomyces sp. ADI97-07]|uniref:hypothetical protein n=1 Tax=Streptomyces sp. ADI97-07 TaxID=1522762 RepID=UPI000F54DE48|nr:hypothetical protein [Streptomyces sp. ADI97-07]RPK69896.1 hypothetical protein EES45_36325 [Streptomyces sp. ADI97-07]